MTKKKYFNKFLCRFFNLEMALYSKTQNYRMQAKNVSILNAYHIPESKIIFPENWDSLGESINQPIFQFSNTREIIHYFKLKFIDEKFGFILQFIPLGSV